jgi:hypothetical protein
MLAASEAMLSKGSRYVNAVRPADDPWDAMIGWLNDAPVDCLDEVVYEPKA